MSERIALIKNFYQAFRRRDWQTMAECYSNDARFHDPVFHDLDANQVRTMWRMVFEHAENLEVRLDEIVEQGDKIEAIWNAHYLFTPTGRQVRNQVTAYFSFDEGKILTHVDDFDLWHWAAQVVGWPGRLFGWTIFVRSSIRDQAQAQLKRYMLNSLA